MATRKKPADDAFAFAAIDPARLAESYREFAEKGLVQSRQAYDMLKTVAEDATRTVEKKFENAQAGGVQLGMKAIETIRANADSTLSHIESLLAAKSVAEAVELQSAFIRKQAEAAIDQARDLEEAVRKVAEDVAKPGKEFPDRDAKPLKTE